MLPTLIGLCFLLSLVFTEVWLYSLFKRAYIIPPNLTLHINHLAKTRLSLVVGFFIMLWLVLLWSGLVLAFSLPLLDEMSGDWVVPAVLIALGSIPALLLYFYLTRNSLLATWFPALACPYCTCTVPLINYWQCPGGCQGMFPRHILTPCPTCGTRLRGLLCGNEYCQQAISFEEDYNEFEIINRGKKYATAYNPIFFGVLFGSYASLVLACLCLRGASLILPICFATLFIAGIVGLLIIKPKRLIENPFYEENDSWTRSQSA